MSPALAPARQGAVAVAVAIVAIVAVVVSIRRSRLA